MLAGALDRRIQFLRAPMVDDGLSTRPGEFVNLGTPVWGSRKDISDGEKAAAGSTYGEVSARFVVRATSFTRTITTKDMLTEGGRRFHILGMKELGRDGFEFTATTRTDT